MSFLSEVRLESRFGPFVVFQENLGFIPNLLQAQTRFASSHRGGVET